jgi:enoyl-CoA hydratase/carnithine racemase
MRPRFAWHVNRLDATTISGNNPSYAVLAQHTGRMLACMSRLAADAPVLVRADGPVARLPQPVIAKVEGMATAAGCQLVAACDLAVATHWRARFATPGVKIGLFCSTPMVPSSRAMGRKRALEMLLTGRPIAAETALDWGLVNRVVPAEALEDELSAIVASSPLTVGLGKEAFHAQIELDEHRAYSLTKAVMAMNARADDAQEGVCAFLEQRPATSRRR